MLMSHTARARRYLDGEIVAAAPARILTWPSLPSMAAGSVAVSALEPALAQLSPVLLLARQAIGRVRHRHASAVERGRYQTMMVVFRPSQIDIHPNEIGRGLGPRLQSYGLDGVRYERVSDLATETRLRVAGADWSIHGWLERDLRDAIGPLGIELETLPGPFPD